MPENTSLPMLRILHLEDDPCDQELVRAALTADGLEFHSDRCDVVGLLCVRKARSGGASRVVSSATIHNEVLRRRPDLIDAFYADWHNSRQGDEQPGEATVRIAPE